MMIWLLALLVLASLAGLGYRQGAIRVAISLAGIFFGVLLALPLSKPFGLLLKALGVTQPVLLWLLPPFIVFCLFSAVSKTIAVLVHKKVEVYFKYHAGDLRLSLWERLNHRLGLCLGLVNGVAYFSLLAFVIYLFSYWTIQMDTGTGAHWSVRMLNSAGRDLSKTGFGHTARAFDKMPRSYYDAADAAGIIFQNSLLEARLARYPAFLMLGERPEFQALATDREFSEMRMGQASLNRVMQYGPIKAIVENPDTLRMLWSLVEPNLADLNVFLTNGVSDKFADQPLIGRWNFDARSTAAALRKARPNITATEMQRFRRTMDTLYSRTRLVIGLEGAEQKVVIKDLPSVKENPPPGTPLTLQNGQGTWSGGGSRYQLDFTLADGELKIPAGLESGRLLLTINKNVIVFERED